MRALVRSELSIERSTVQRLGVQLMKESASSPKPAMCSKVQSCPRAKLAVLHVISGLGPGGAESVLFRLATRAQLAEHEVICLGPRDWYSERLEEHGIRVHHVDIRSPFAALKGLWRLYRLMKGSAAEVVQCWMYRANLVGGVCGRLAGKPVIWNIRCSDVHLYPATTRLLAKTGGFLARWLPQHVLNCSISSRLEHARIGYDSAPSDVIPNGYDPAHFYPDRAARAITRRSLGIGPKIFLLGTIGRWDVQKAYPILFRALRLLRDRGVQMRLLLAGRGLDSTNSDLARIADESDCKDIVLSLGYRSDAANIARALDLHVLASFTEGFPNVVAETMLSGTPNVVTDVGDSSLIVGDTGWIVTAADPVALADAIERAYREWSSERARWTNRRRAVRQRIKDKFSLEQMVDAYEGLWQQIASKKPAAGPLCSADRARDSRARSPLSVPRPLCVLHIINGLGLGGAETLLYRLSTENRRNKHVVVSLGDSGWYSSLLRERGVVLHHLGMRSVAGMPAAVFRLRRIVRDVCPDVVQCWMYRSNLFGGLVAKAEKRPVVWGIHNCSFEPLRLPSRALVYLGGLLARWIPDFIVNCSSTSFEVHKKLGYSAAEGGVINNGYDPTSFYPDEPVRKAMRRQLGIRPAEFAIGSIARWDSLKDIPNLLRAVRIARDQIDIRCLLVGTRLGPSNVELLDLMARLGCIDFVLPLESRSDIDDIARALDLHVLASRTEAFPNVVAETMLSGTPNVVTDVGDCAHMVGDSGWIVPPGNPEDLARAIVEAHHEWRNDPELWAARGTAARKRIADNFSLSEMADTYDRVWRTISHGSAFAAHRLVLSS